MTHEAYADSAHPDDHPHGWRRWLYSTNHKDIGTIYLTLALVGGVVGGLLSMGMRLELMRPGLQIFGNAEMFNVFITAHGLIMVFFMVMPATMGGFGNWMVPLIRCAGHGLPAHEQSLLLAASRLLGAASHILVHAWISRCERCWRGLDGLRSPHHEGHTRSSHGFRHSVVAPGWCLLRSRRHQLHHNHFKYACAGHDAA